MNDIEIAMKFTDDAPVPDDISDDGGVAEIPPKSSAQIDLAGRWPGDLSAHVSVNELNDTVSFSLVLLADDSTASFSVGGSLTPDEAEDFAMDLLTCAEAVRDQSESASE